MTKLFITASSHVDEAELTDARLGPRFGRLDLQSRLAVLAVHSLGVNFEAMDRRRVAVVLEAVAGSLTTDLDFWNSRNEVGGPSPTLFAYTLPSAALGEIAIHFKLMGPNLCFAGVESGALAAAAELLRRGEADACVCVSCAVVSDALAGLTGDSPRAEAAALLLQCADSGLRELAENDRDIKTVCALTRNEKFT